MSITYSTTLGNNMKTLSGIIRRIRLNEEDTQSEAAKKMDISLRTYQRFEKNPEDNIKVLKTFMTFYDINDDKMTDIPFLVAHHIIPAIQTKNEQCPDNSIAMDDGTDKRMFDKSAEGYFNLDVNKNIFTTIAQGNSMFPTFSLGDLLHVIPFEEESKQIQDNAIYMIENDQGTMIRRIAIHPTNNTLVLSTDDKKNDFISIEESDAHLYKIRGRVIGYCRKI